MFRMDRTQDPSNELLAETWVEKQRLALRILDLYDQPSLYGHVISIVEPENGESTEQETDYANLERGTQVRIRENAKHEQHRNRVGFVMNPEPNMRGEVKIAFEDGSRDSFYAGLLKSTREREFDVIGKDQRRVVMILDGRIFEVNYPSEMKLSVGDTVKVSSKTMQILGVANSLNLGVVATIEQNNGNGTCQVILNGSLRSVSIGSIDPEKIQQGHDVLLDSTGSIVIAYLGKPKIDFHLAIPSGVSWDDIGGLEDAKEQLQDTIDLPFGDPDLFAYHKTEIPSGALVMGPPGGGKGMLADAYTTALGKHFNELVPRGCIKVNAPEILRGIVGRSERLIKDIFTEGNRLYDELGYCVIIIDEIDAIGKKRGTGISTDVNDSIVPALLTQINGFKGMLIAITNRQDVLDDALIRSGRMDLKIVVPRPDRDAAEKIFRVHLRKKPLSGTELDAMAKFSADELHSDAYAFFRIDLAKKTAEEKAESLLFKLGHISSGAMIASIVNAASRIALKRDRAAKTRTGITKEDILLAIKREFEQNIPLDHSTALKEFAEDIKDKVTGVHKLRQGIQ